MRSLLFTMLCAWLGACSGTPGAAIRAPSPASALAPSAVVPKAPTPVGDNKRAQRSRPPAPVAAPPPAFEPRDWTLYQGPSPDATEHLYCDQRVVHKGWAGYLLSCRSYVGAFDGTAVIVDARGSRLEQLEFDDGDVLAQHVYGADGLVRFVRYPKRGKLAKVAGTTRDGALEGPLSKWDRKGVLVESDVYERGVVVAEQKLVSEIMSAAKSAQSAIEARDGSALAGMLSSASLARIQAAKLLALKVIRSELAGLKPHQQALVLMMRSVYGTDLPRASPTDMVARGICPRACLTLRFSEFGKVHVLGNQANVELLMRGRFTGRVWFLWQNQRWALALDRLMDQADQAARHMTVGQIAQELNYLLGGRVTPDAWEPPSR